MKKYLVLGLTILVSVAFIICLLIKCEIIFDYKEKKEPVFFSFQGDLVLVHNQIVDVTIKVSEAFDKLEVEYNDSIIHSWANIADDVTFRLGGDEINLGTSTIYALATSADGNEVIDKRFVRVLSDIAPKESKVEVVKTYPHNPTSFTQGLAFYDGALYEGTGDPGAQGKTLVAEVELNSGQHRHRVRLGPEYFGEGITIFDGLLYQLTYRKGKCFVYNLASDFNLEKVFNYKGQGWGLSHDGKRLIMSNGTERLYFRDPMTFEVLGTIDVYDNEGPVSRLNELEYVDGKIYANVWLTDFIVVIDPETGKVLERIDAALLTHEGRGDGEVLNGIAFDESTQKLYMTGKYWDKLFEVRIIGSEI